MNKWIKYLLPVILTVAFWNCTDENESSVPEYTAADISIVESSYQSNFSETESEPCLPDLGYMTLSSYVMLRLTGKFGNKEAQLFQTQFSFPDTLDSESMLKSIVKYTFPEQEED